MEVKQDGKISKLLFTGASGCEGTFLKPREHRNPEECGLATPVSSFSAALGLGRGCRARACLVDGVG